MTEEHRNITVQIGDGEPFPALSLKFEPMPDDAFRQRFGRTMNELAYQFQMVFAPMIRDMVDVLGLMFGSVVNFVSIEDVERHMIEHVGWTEADIRSITRLGPGIWEARRWNGRRHTVLLADLT